MYTFLARHNWNCVVSILPNCNLERMIYSQVLYIFTMPFGEFWTFGYNLPQFGKKFDIVKLSFNFFYYYWLKNIKLFVNIANHLMNNVSNNDLVLISHSTFILNCYSVWMVLGKFINSLVDKIQELFVKPYMFCMFTLVCKWFRVV